MAELGLWGITIDEDHGGSPADARTRCIVIEEIQRAGACLAYAYVPTALFCAEALGRFGTGDQQRAPARAGRGPAAHGDGAERTGLRLGPHGAGDPGDLRR